MIEFVDSATGQDPVLASRLVMELMRNRSHHSRIERIGKPLGNG